MNSWLVIRIWRWWLGGGELFGQGFDSQLNQPGTNNPELLWIEELDHPGKYKTSKLSVSRAGSCMGLQ